MTLPASTRVLEFFNDCHDPKDGRFCHWGVSRKYSRGVLGKGTESHGTRAELCGKGAGASGLCAVHEKVHAKMEAENARRRKLVAEGKMKQAYPGRG